ncbi:MAG: DUF6600 domain-containing protein [Caulobacteraceae bacterium]
MTTPRQVLLALGLAFTSAAPAILATSIATPAHAQVSVSISFDTFRSRLSPYGTWTRHPRWGDVWRPRAGRDFRPYYDGHWVNTREYGWLWVPAESWGDIPYHYGRWVYDPGDGWLWVPGYVWGPSWVVWRSGGGRVGWFPMPPGDNYYGEGAYRDDFDNYYGYRNWYGSSFGQSQFLSLWIFVGEDHLGDRDYRRYVAPQRDYSGFIGQTRNSTNYVTVNNYVVNRSIDESRLPSRARQAWQPVAASSVIGRNALVTQAPVGRQVEQRERQQRPIPASPATARNAPVPEARGQGPQGSGQNRAEQQRPTAPAQEQRREAPAQPSLRPQENRGALQQREAPAQRAVPQVEPRGANPRDRGPETRGAAEPRPQESRAAPSAAATPQPREAPAPQAESPRANPAARGPQTRKDAQPRPQESRAAPPAAAPPQAREARPADSRGQGQGQGQGQGNARGRGGDAGDGNAPDQKKGGGGRNLIGF